MVENPGRPIRKVSWSEFEELAKKIAKHVSQNAIYVNHICGISRGGLPLAVRLSHLLNIPMISEAELLNDVYHGKELLIVDDICDSGTTLNAFFHSIEFEGDSYPNIATLFLRDQIVEKSPTIVGEVIKDEWIEFPWEAKDE